MNRESLSNMTKLTQETLYDKRVTRIYNSIGSNLFVEIGHEILDPLDGDKRPEWIVWVSNNSWRITKDNDYIVGSGDNRNDIKIGINQLLDKSIKKFHFTSDFLDMQIDFDNGYRLNTFLDSIEENEWTIYMPDGNTIRLGNLIFDDIKSVQKIGKEFAINQKYKPIEMHLKNPIIKALDISEHDELRITLENDGILYLIYPIWRIERNREFVLGYFHDEQPNAGEILSGLIGKEIKQISVANGLMDAQFLIGNDIVLRTFALIRSDHQWEIYNKDDEVLFGVDIELRDL